VFVSDHFGMLVRVDLNYGSSLLKSAEHVNADGD
jgi:hypothetical protein